MLTIKTLNRPLKSEIGSFVYRVCGIRSSLLAIGDFSGRNSAETDGPLSSDKLTKCFKPIAPPFLQASPFCSHHVVDGILTS